MISIVIPTFNAAATLAACLRSIAMQDSADYEVVLVDGQSTDETLAIVRAHADQLAGLQLLSEPDRGIYDAMNKGVAMARGQWLFFMGADDALAAPDVLRRVQAELDEGVDLLYGDIRRMSKDRVEGGPTDRGELMHSNICHQAIFYRKSLLQVVGAYNLDYPIYADWDLNYRCFAVNDRQRYVKLTISHFSGSGFSASRVDHVFMARRLPSLARLYGVSYWGDVFRPGRHVFLGDAMDLRDQGRWLASAGYYLIFAYHGVRHKIARLVQRLVTQHGSGKA